jgi:hypothetical protein
LSFKKKQTNSIKEIEPRCAEALCRLFPSDPSIDIMSIARKAQNNRKHPSSRSQSRSPVSIDVSPSLPIESSSSVIIKRQLSKDHTRRSSPTTKHRPISSTKDSSSRHRYRSPSNHDLHRSDVTLYLLNLRLTYLVILFSTNHIKYRTFKKDIG